MIFLSVCLSSLFVRSFARSSSVYLDIGRGIYHSAVPARRGTARLSIACARVSHTTLCASGRAGSTTSGRREKERKEKGLRPATGDTLALDRDSQAPSH